MHPNRKLLEWNRGFGRVIETANPPPGFLGNRRQERPGPVAGAFFFSLAPDLSKDLSAEPLERSIATKAILPLPIGKISGQMIGCRSQFGLSARFAMVP